MTAEEYVKQEYLAGRLTNAHIAELTCHFQGLMKLTVDGKPGPSTRAALDAWARPIVTVYEPKPFLICPLPTLKDGRKAVVTSGFHSVNPDRPDHNGCDWFYPWKEGDDLFIGDGGAAGRNGKPKWIIPVNTPAYASADGVVQIAGNSRTGYRCWVDHGNGWRTGYFHLSKLFVHAGDHVQAGFTQLGLVGDNPSGFDARHLHQELSPVDRYAPVNLEPWLLP